MAGAAVATSPLAPLPEAGGNLAAREIMRAAATLLLDPSQNRWSVDYLLLALDDAIREIAVMAPNILARSVVLILRPGAFQELPREFESLLRVTRNVEEPVAGQIDRRNGRESTITRASRRMLDAVEPGWTDPTIVAPSDIVRHVVYDPGTPRSFLVYPPAYGGGAIEIDVLPNIGPLARKPGNDGKPGTLFDQTHSLPLSRIHAPALRDYVVSFCLDMEGDIPGSAQRAAAFRARFEAGLANYVTASATLNPDTINGPTSGDQ